MYKLIAILACLSVITTAKAQLQALVPTPFGVALTVGQWLFFNNKKVYYIEVKGSGRTAEDARLNGFRLAVEQALGSVILSETEMQNSSIKRDEVISYAAGFVERYEIVNTIPTGSGYEIGMRVWVQRTNLAERLLVKSQADGQVDGARAAIAVDTAQFSRAQGDLLLLSVLRDFPERSFDIKLEPTRVEMTADRGAVLVIPYELAWNKKYINSYFSARKSVSTCGWNGCFMDNPTLNLFHDEIVRSFPNVQVTINSQAGAVIHRYCFPLNDDYSVNDDRFINLAMPRKHSYIMPVSQQNLASMSQVEFRVVRAKNCLKQVL